jgi:hypothetical protein
VWVHIREGRRCSALEEEDGVMKVLSFCLFLFAFMLCPALLYSYHALLYSLAGAIILIIPFLKEPQSSVKGIGGESLRNVIVIALVLVEIE